MNVKEAFSFVVHELERNTNFTKDSTFGKAVDMLNDLVEKDTPKNTYLKELLDVKLEHCPTCNLIIDNGYGHCSSCGQKLIYDYQRIGK